MKALREAKAYLARQAWSDKWAELHPNDPAVLLAALVEAVEAAPVGQAIAHANRDGEWAEIDGLGHDDLDALDGQRVRVLAVGEG